MRPKRLKRSAHERVLVESAIAAYAQWRGQSAAVRTAYRRWAAASVAERRAAFEDYSAALDREERAATRYAELLSRAGHLQMGGLARQLIEVRLSARGR